MPVQFKDYYEVLGVARDASDADIKKAFRKLAAKYHPDVAKDKVAAEAKFKEINEANEVLSDPEKRRKYDELGANWNRPGWQAAHEQQSRGFGGRPDEGTEFHFEGTGFSDFFEQFFGSRGRSAGGFGSWGGGSRVDFAQPGQDIEGDILVTLNEALSGSTRDIRLQRTDPRTGRSSFETLRVKIPAGVREGQLIRLTGKGQEGTGGGESGNLYLKVSFAKHPEFRVEGANLYHELELAPWEAVLGATIRIRSLDGEVSLKIPPETVAERQFRLRGKGLPAGDGTRGDLLVVVSIHVPAQSTPAEKALWEKLAAQSSFDPRKPG